MPTYYSVNGEGDLNNVYLHNYEEYLVTDTFVTSGRLWAWGYNFSGQLGNNTNGAASYKSSPVQTVSGGTNWKQVSCGIDHTAAIKTDNSLWLWGNNSSGQLGDNSITNRSSPVQTVSGGTNWKQVSCGTFFTAAIKTDGSLWLWGRGVFGELGDNSRAVRSSPVQTVSGGTNWRLVSCFGKHTAAIKTDGTLWLWGINDYGQLGDNTNGDLFEESSINSKSSPVQTIAGGTNWKSVSAGRNHTAAIKTDGTLWLWGGNQDTDGLEIGDPARDTGALGTNNVINYSSPVQTVSGGTNWKSVSCGRIHTAAIKTDGSLWLWGSGSGPLGANDQTIRSSPIQTVSGGTNWKYVSAGDNITAAIKTDNSLWLWGTNFSGQLGTNDTTSRSSPVQTVAGGTIWRQVSPNSLSGSAVVAAVTY